jgi:hypothetical protein
LLWLLADVAVIGIAAAEEVAGDAGVVVVVAMVNLLVGGHVVCRNSEGKAKSDRTQERRKARGRADA